MLNLYRVINNCVTYIRQNKADDFGYAEPEDVDVSKFSHIERIIPDGKYSASWNKVGLFASADKGVIRINGSLPDDCDNYTWQINKKVPLGEKAVAIDITKSTGDYLWGNKLFSFQINGRSLLPINKSLEGDEDDPFIAKTTGTVYYELSDDISSIKTIGFKTAAGKNIDIEVKNIRIYAKQSVYENKNIELLAPSVNQLGYVSGLDNKIVLSFNSKIDSLEEINYEIIDAKNNSVVKRGTISDFSYFAGSGRSVASVDISWLKTSGEYSVRLPEQKYVKKTLSSVKFEINRSSSGLYDKLRKDALVAYSYWTSGKSGPYDSHVQDKNAIDFTTKKTRDVYGGWYDAGDYGKYVTTGGYSVGLMLLAKNYFPEKFNYDVGQVPLDDKRRSDYLSQIKTECDWFLKMQNNDGSVNHKVASREWPGERVSPENDNLDRFVMPISTTATANFAASLAMAAVSFSVIDTQLSKKYLQAAEKAWAFLEKNQELIMTKEKYNDGVYGGPYTDKSDRDERFWASVELYKATGQQRYKNYVVKNVAAILDNAKTCDWQDVGSLALFSLYNSEINLPIKNRIFKWAKNYADNTIELQKQNPYRVAIDNGRLEWGSNSKIITNALYMLLISKISKEKQHRDSAFYTMDYILGNNPIGISYITGYGEKSAKDPHFRPHMSGKYKLPAGFLVGGPNNVDIGGDSILAGVWSEAGYLRYVDDHRSWATNEVAINWNAALVAVTSILCDK